MANGYVLATSVLSSRGRPISAYLYCVWDGEDWVSVRPEYTEERLEALARAYPTEGAAMLVLSRIDHTRMSRHARCVPISDLLKDGYVSLEKWPGEAE